MGDRHFKIKVNSNNTANKLHCHIPLPPLTRDGLLFCTSLYMTFFFFSMFQVNCLFLDGVTWSGERMKIGSFGGENIECLTDHLSSFTMVVVQDTEVDSQRACIINFLFSQTF